MRVEKQLALFGVPGQMDLPDAVGGDPGQKGPRVEAMVVRADKDVVHV